MLMLRFRALAPVRLRDVLGLSNPAGTFFASAIAAGENGLRPLQLAFEGPSTGENIIYTPQPNPSHGNDVIIPVQLVQPQIVHLQLTDLTGRVLFENVQALDAGSHMLVLPAAVLAQPGMYGWQVQAGSIVASGKLIKM